MLLALCSSVNSSVNSWHSVTVEAVSNKVKFHPALLHNFTLTIYFSFLWISFALWFSSVIILFAFDSKGIAKAIMAPGAMKMQFPSTSEGMLLLPQCFLFHLHTVENMGGCIVPGSPKVSFLGCQMFFIVLSAQFSLKLSG